MQLSPDVIEYLTCRTSVQLVFEIGSSRYDNPSGAILEKLSSSSPDFSKDSVDLSSLSVGIDDWRINKSVVNGTPGDVLIASEHRSRDVPGRLMILPNPAPVGEFIVNLSYYPLVPVCGIVVCGAC